MTEIKITYENWKKEALKRYPDKNIAFVCPVCGYRQTIEDYKAAGAPQGAWGFACIGRFLDKDKCRQAFGGKNAGKTRRGPCDYTGGGLFRLNPLTIIMSGPEISSYEQCFFDFADDPLCKNEKTPPL